MLATPSTWSVNIQVIYNAYTPQNDQSVQSWTHANSLVGDVDYVSHNDILPFAPSESVGFRNGLYSIYFRRRSALAHQLAASSECPGI
jgi:hypothetical protein